MAMDNATPTLESMLEFQQVYLRAIALSWEDKSFRNELLKNPADALARYLDYRCPWLIDLEVVDPGGQYGWDEHNQRWNLPPNTMTVGIPARPELPGEEAVALAAYSDAGPNYVFTCC
ncbi:BMA_0021/BMA_0022 family TOMM bacteriocin [Paraburkholderia sp. 22099]|jgi:ribosomally synthesized peptide (two-chain TOMM family)|uniref:Ribosomally synthesized peptide (Two-chain TOMM family) n=1 Tax=Paraburkholderia terricola TaxID=169427 RepID=A0ABU1LIY8_9BURK|nr:BMA_0021/BMA_0022 family TOMM bacteriocin [Paraburkholderia terricola]MDR6406693.1 ribosomally synthesized peptide (two-chain TOMM family) [Paraburkholderia terricola]MDR6446525.1 ribosomally synthesized peptide (two-chain TOMM family) [Paraburkholderia terricola]MDR6479627.1 ribosomally synthesized peptide (two-chain TOMM family) [Paraburkholderia terricola]ORC51306.1 hypothetical protein B2G74_00655 [Burkholderia sp. A27]